MYGRIETLSACGTDLKRPPSTSQSSISQSVRTPPHTGRDVADDSSARRQLSPTLLRTESPTTADASVQRVAQSAIFRRTSD